MAQPDATPEAGPPPLPDPPALSPQSVRTRHVHAAVAAALSGGLLVVAWSLTPASSGFGTHRALGLPACSWPERFGVPCPSCGMTTSFAYAAKGDLVASFVTQPFGCVLAVATGMTFVASLWTLATGRTVWPVYERFWNARTAWVLGIAALLAWGYKTVDMCGWFQAP